MSASYILLAAAGSGALVLAGTAGSLDVRPADFGSNPEVPIGFELFEQENSELLPPRRWSCEEIFPEYRTWLDEGNAPTDWKFAGRSFYDPQLEQGYSWEDWLQWAASSECEGAAAFRPEVAALVPAAAAATGLGSAATAAGVAAAAAAATAAATAGGGQPADSPG